jgi:hypothetical protein
METHTGSLILLGLATIVRSTIVVFYSCIVELSVCGANHRCGVYVTEAPNSCNSCSIPPCLLVS